MQGNKVKLVMKFEGRELQFKDQGKQLLMVRRAHLCKCVRARVRLREREI